MTGYAARVHCQMLFDLSGWDCKRYHYWNSEVESDSGVRKFATFGSWQKSEGSRFSGVIYACPAYDLGYLVRQLPSILYDDEIREQGVFGLTPSTYGGWIAKYTTPDHRNIGYEADAMSPEDAVVLLALQLFDQDVLRRKVWP